MGQQQLLLLVLGIVIVGLAVVVGIQAFGENQKKANADALTNDAIRIVSDAQAWNLKPTAFGGGNGSFVGLTLAKLGYEATGAGLAGVYTNLNTGTIADNAGNGFKICSSPVAGQFVLVGNNVTRTNGVKVTVSGTGPGQIATEVSTSATC